MSCVNTLNPSPPKPLPPPARHFLRELREYQQTVKLLDETAAEVVKEYARRHVEQHLSKAVDAIRITGGAQAGGGGRGQACGAAPEQGRGRYPDHRWGTGRGGGRGYHGFTAPSPTPTPPAGLNRNHDT